MKPKLIILTAALGLAAVSGRAQFTIASTSFENEGDSANGTYAATDSTNLSLGSTIALSNTDDDSDTVFLNSTSASTTAGDLGFSATFTNTRDDSGLSDGDFVGISDFTGAPLGYTGKDGTFAYQIGDPDGLLEVTFDTVDISSYTSVGFSLDYAVGDTGYESDDLFQIWYSIDSAPRVNIIDFGETDLEAASSTSFTTASASGLVGSALQIGFNFDSNSASETLGIDSLSVTAIPEPSVAALVLIGLGLFIHRFRKNN